MKKIILAILISAPLTTLVAQDIPETQVPSVVLNAFKVKFSDVDKLEWERKGELYKAEFEIDRQDHDIWIDKSGTITKHKTDIPYDQLPRAIQEKISTEFKTYKVDDTDKVETGNKVVYIVELESKTGDRDVVFTPDGNIETQ